MKKHVGYLLLALAAAATNASEPLSARLEEGKAVYETHCAKCHRTGIRDAPIANLPEDWHHRSNNWEAVLFEHANAGYLAMPAKGGAGGLNEYDVDVAAEYMLTLSHPGAKQD
jgi:cytochrome c5